MCIDKTRLSSFALCSLTKTLIYIVHTPAAAAWVLMVFVCVSGGFVDHT